MGSVVILLGSRCVGSITILNFSLHLFNRFFFFSLSSSSRSRKFLLWMLTQDLLEAGTFLRMWFSAGLHSKILLASNGCSVWPAEINVFFCLSLSQEFVKQFHGLMKSNDFTGQSVCTGLGEYNCKCEKKNVCGCIESGTKSDKLPPVMSLKVTLVAAERQNVCETISWCWVRKKWEYKIFLARSACQLGDSDWALYF